MISTFSRTFSQVPKLQIPGYRKTPRIQSSEMTIGAAHDRLCSSGSSYRFEWQRSCVSTYPTCGNPSCDFSPRGQPLHWSHTIRAANEHRRRGAGDDNRVQFVETQIRRQTFVRSRLPWGHSRCVPHRTGDDFFARTFSLACVGRRTGRHSV